MNTYTFRTECKHDNAQVPALLKSIGVKNYIKKTLNDPVLPTWAMGQYTIKTDDTFTQLIKKLKNEIDNNNKFVDMHRCYQTLNTGHHPKF